MAIFGVAGVLMLFGLIALPQLWIRRIMQRHSVERPDLPGTGGELVEHLLDSHGLNSVRLERANQGAEGGDHYDPERRAICLSPSNFDGRSLTAVAVAAHEFSHALQHHDGLNGGSDAGLGLRQKLAGLAQVTDRFASLFFLAAPVLGLLARTPLAFVALIGVGVALLGVRILVHLVTLPVEMDASFSRALPILEEGGYLKEKDLPAARSVLKAAAYTYVASAVMSLIDLARWIRILR